MEEMGSEAKFEIKRKKNENFVRMLQGISNEFVIDLNTANVRNEVIILNQMVKLHLDDLYNEHKEYVMDIIKSKYANSPECIMNCWCHFQRYLICMIMLKICYI